MTMRIMTNSQGKPYTSNGKVLCVNGSGPTPPIPPTPPTPSIKTLQVIGNLTNVNQVYSGFSDDDYIALSTDLLTPGNTYVFKFTTGEDIERFQNVLAPNDWFEIYVENGYLMAWTESEGHNVLIAIVETNTTYWVKVETSNISYQINLSYSLDGTIYSQAVHDTFEPGNTDLFRIGRGVWVCGNRQWDGSIDIGNSYIINSSGVIVW